MTGMTLTQMYDTHRIYEIYPDRREAIRGSEKYGDMQVHISAWNSNRLPVKVSKRAKPFGKKKGYPIWYYLPGMRIDMILILFEQAGYDVVQTELGRTVMGEQITRYIVAKKK
ncbi:hypothetical protein KAU33_04500 [Candidatus Dependentiae bacterium]|nr:hypothetical protein [Candidatus Dependentiae bacterium]